MRISRRAGRVKNEVTQAIAKTGVKSKLGEIMYSQGERGQVVRLTPKYSKGVMK